MSQPAVYGVIGNPIKHSLSPKIHQLWYEMYGLHATYHALELASYTAEKDIQALARMGYEGLNITLPHKVAAFDASTTLSEPALKIGAVNTLKSVDENDDRLWYGDNTDWSGFLWALYQVCSVIPEKALILGAGGAARGVSYALRQKGVTLDILNRTVEKAESLCENLDLKVGTVSSLESLPELSDEHSLIINTVSLGHTGGSLDLPKTDEGVFFDISYGPAADETLENVSKSGWTGVDGLPMLVGQAADSFKLWFGIDPDRKAALNLIYSLIGTKRT